jgi:RNA polymerase sigma factor (sigma-70 family)
MPQTAQIAPEQVKDHAECESADVSTDQQLLQIFNTHQGETAERAFAAVVERYGPLVAGVCRDVLGGSHDVQDAAQAVFLVLARKARSIRKPESLGPWLHGVALRVARRARADASRRRSAERKRAELMHEVHAAPSGPEIMDHAALHDEINRLPEKYRKPIILCYLHEQTQAQAALALGWPLGTVQVRLHRGRERLRSRLARQGGALTAAPLGNFLKARPALSHMCDQEWVRATARAAGRFADGQAAAGLVAPSVARLAESTLTAMLGDAFKGAALIAGAVLVGAGCLWYLGSGVPQVQEARNSSPQRPPASPDRDRPASAATTSEKSARADAFVATLPAASSSTSVPRTRSAASLDVIPAPPVLSAPDPGPASAPRATQRPGSLASHGPDVDQSPVSGRELFERSWVKNDRRSHGGDGLGPVFNAQSCVDCHHLGGTGGAGGTDRNIEIGTPGAGRALTSGMGYSYSFSMDFGAGRMEYRFGDNDTGWSGRPAPADLALLAAIHPGFRDAPSVVLHRFGTDPAYNGWRESLSGPHGSITVVTSQRNTPSLFGAGLIDGISDAVIEAAAKRRLPASAPVKGRVSRLKDGRVGRFGWKGQTAALGDFVRAAAAGEIGLEVPGRAQGADPRLPGLAATGLDMDEAECQALVAFVRSLPPPFAVRTADDKELAQIKAGESTFKAIGCTACHVPALGDVQGIYSDLLLHDMGPQLADIDAYAVFSSEPNPVAAPVVAADRGGTRAPSAREWRTPPLWGIRDSDPYLHDGRAADLGQAIALHGGQGATSARRFADLSARRKQQVEAFLGSLGIPRKVP